MNKKKDVQRNNYSKKKKLYYKINRNNWIKKVKCKSNS